MNLNRCIGFFKNVKNKVVYFINTIVYREDIEHINIKLQEIEKNKVDLKQNDLIETQITDKIKEHNKVIRDLREQKKNNEEKEQELLDEFTNNIIILKELVSKNRFLTEYFHNKKEKTVIE